MYCECGWSVFTGFVCYVAQQSVYALSAQLGNVQTFVLLKMTQNGKYSSHVLSI
jgi:hypothetical protein